MAVSSGPFEDKVFQEENPSLKFAVLHMVSSDCIVVHLIVAADHELKQAVLNCTN